METVRGAIELSAVTVEILGVAIIVFAVVSGAIRYLVTSWRVADAYQQCKVQLAKALLLGLEFLVAADVIRTVVLEATLQNIGILALLVVVRTFLSWSIVVELESRWPWVAERPSGADDRLGRPALSPPPA